VAAVGGGALCFLLYSIEMKNSSHLSFWSAIKCCNKYFFVIISPNLVFFSNFF
jgi:hypothetical protein